MKIHYFKILFAIVLLMVSVLSPLAQVRTPKVNPFFIGNIIVDEDDLSKVISVCEYYNFSLSDSTASSCTFIAPDGSSIVYQHSIRQGSGGNDREAHLASSTQRVKVSIKDNADSLKDMLFKCGFRKRDGTYTRKSTKKKGLITYTQTKSHPKTLLFTFQPSQTEK